MLVEELLDGRLVTFEGFMHDGSMTPVGITDSVMHPNGISFVGSTIRARSLLSGRPPGRDRRRAHAGARLRRLAVQHRVLRVGRRDREDRRGERPHGITVRAARAGRARHVHVPDPARAGDRRSSDAPRGSPRLVASSFVLRRYVEDAVVEAVPDPTAVTDRFPGSQVEVLVRPGQRLSDNDDDSASHRLAVVAMSGPDRATLLRDWEEAQRLLPFALRSVDRSSTPG